MDVQEDSTTLNPSEFAPIDREDHVSTSEDKSVDVITPNEDILKVLDSTTTLEGGALKRQDSDKTDVAQVRKQL